MAVIASTTALAAGATLYEGKKQRDAAKAASRQQAAGVEAARQDTQQGIQQATGTLAGNYLTGDNSSPSAINALTQGYGQSSQTLSPLAQMALPYQQEQSDLLGLSGKQAQQQAMSRVSDPLAAAQETAILRNNASLGGVGGNVLSALAQQTADRTQANIGTRLGQLSNASMPSLNALQAISNNQIGQGQGVAGILGQLANTQVGGAGTQAQLSQNLGNANAGYNAYVASNPNPTTQALTSGLNTFTGLGGINALQNSFQNNSIGNQGFNAINNAGLF